MADNSLMERYHEYLESTYEGKGSARPLTYAAWLLYRTGGTR